MSDELSLEDLEAMVYKHILLNTQNFVDDYNLVRSKFDSFDDFEKVMLDLIAEMELFNSKSGKEAPFIMTSILLCQPEPDDPEYNEEEEELYLFNRAALVYYLSHQSEFDGFSQFIQSRTNSKKP